MGLTHVTVRLRNLATPNGGYEADFLVDTGATDSLAPGAELKKIGLRAIGRTVYELANGRVESLSMDWPTSPSWEKLPQAGSSLVRTMLNHCWV
jgi:predicted aspartyl protease